MKSVFDYIENIQSKPHHVRKRIAFSIAGGVTAVIALAWITSSVSTGIFALKASSFGDTPPPANQSALDSANLAGASAALPPGTAAEPARIEIVDTASSSTKGVKAEQTVIPF